ncbi:MAG: hypothetical protein ACRDQA_03130 [Nocardioidaceae bacterium]
MATIIPYDLDPARTYVLIHERQGEWVALEVRLGSDPRYGSRTWVEFIDRRRDSDSPRGGPAV